MSKKKLDKLLQDCTVRLSDSINGGTGNSGTGFFIAPGGWIATCNHVVEQSDRVSVALVDINDGQEFTAEVKLRLPDPIDFSLLKIEGKVPSHKCVYLDRELPRRGDRLSAFGYPWEYSKLIYSGGDTLTAEYEGESFQEDQLILKLKAGQVQDGFSGSPILNDRTNKICGIISKTRNTEIDLGGRAIHSIFLFESKFFKSYQQKNLIREVLEKNQEYHDKINKTWSRIVQQQPLERKTALFYAIFSVLSLVFIYLRTPENLFVLGVWRLVSASSLGYSIFLFIKSLSLHFFTASRLPAGFLLGFLTTVSVFGLSFIIAPEETVILRNLTGINEYPVLGLIENQFPIPLKETLEIGGEPIVDTNNPVYEAIQAFSEESGNAGLMTDYEEYRDDGFIGISSAFNQNGTTIQKVIAGQKAGDLNSIRQDSEAFEQEPKRFQGESQEFLYASVLMPFRSSIEDAKWTFFLQPKVEDGSYENMLTGSVVQYPKLSDVQLFGDFRKFISSTTDNTWLQKIISENPDVRGFLAFAYQYVRIIPAEASSLVTYLFPCGYAGISRQMPTPYVRFLDLENKSFSPIKIDSIRFRAIEKSKYKLSPVFERDRLFQELPATEDIVGISIPPASHLIIPTEFGFDTRSSKFAPADQSIDVTTLLNQNIYMPKIPPRSDEGLITVPTYDEFNRNNYLSSFRLTQDFLFDLTDLSRIDELIPNRFAVGSLRNIVSIRINGEDIKVDNPLSDPRFSMSAYFAYGSCPYLMVYDSQKGYWIEQGTLITGKQNKARKSYEIHSLDDKISKIRIEERDREITYLDSISILYTDKSSDKVIEIQSQVPELFTAGDESYLVLNQNDYFEMDLKSVLPKDAIDVRLKVDGYYEILPEARQPHLLDTNSTRELPHQEPVMPVNSFREETAA